jgi:glycosyltransferase involved in cell wall biosynthesis
MAKLESPILTIAIPTYNRAKYLKRCLFYITKQININDNAIELVVSDNNSNDETNQVVKYFIELGYNIKYIKSNDNLGPDINIDKCYEIAMGKYVLALGDDDIIITNSLFKILEILKNEDYGVVYLNSKPIVTNEIYNFNSSILNTTKYKDQNKFLNKIGYNITFISANIINKKFYDKNITSKYYGSNMVQVPFIMNAILSSENNLIINDFLLRAQVDNTGGYKLLKVFGVNLNQILTDLSNVYQNRKFKKIITDKLLTLFFPFWIIKLKKDMSFGETENPNIVLKQLYKKNYKFWIYCYPLNFMSYNISVVYNFITMIPYRIKKYFDKLSIFILK